jgi:hypothetical protein
MKADTATLADVKLVLTAPIHIQTKRSGYSKAQVDFVSGANEVHRSRDVDDLDGHRRGRASAARGSQARRA